MWIVAVVVTVGVIMSILDTTIVNVALETLARELRASLNTIQCPVIGGLIVDSLSWRWIFFVNIPIAVIALGLAWRLLPADAGRADAGRLDWLGLVLLSPGLAGIVFGLSERPRRTAA